MTFWQSVQTNMTWKGVIIASLAAGSVFMATFYLLAPAMLDIEGVLLPKYVASLLLGEGAVTDGENATVAIGFLLHYLLSFVFSLLIAVVVHRWGLAVGVIGGCLMGLALYGVNLFTFTVIFEWFFALESTTLLISHVLFGMTAGGIYEIFDHYDVPFELGGD